MGNARGPSPQGKVGEPLMRPYEVMVIFDASLEDDDIRALIDRFTQQLKTAGAKSVSVDNWGKRRLAYPVRHRNEGYYVVIEANGEPAALSELGRQLSLADEVLRHKIMRLPERSAGRSRPAASPDPSTAVAANTNGA
jgi:small subunit ribosomal protein S6